MPVDDAARCADSIAGCALYRESTGSTPSTAAGGRLTMQHMTSKTMKMNTPKMMPTIIMATQLSSLTSRSLVTGSTWRCG